jgi:hypothetical protein
MPRYAGSKGHKNDRPAADGSSVTLRDIRVWAATHGVDICNPVRQASCELHERQQLARANDAPSEHA